jgi:ATP-dependent helicase/nuclease subunit A
MKNIQDNHKQNEINIESETQNTGLRWTKEQSQAIFARDCNLLVAAAAGSGKTAVLVERIIRRITDKENPVDIDRMLIVTFTNAAAAEMRERIGEAIAKEIDKHPESENMRRQLSLLARANIMTIHSFCKNVISKHIQEIDIDPNFRVADETESTLMRIEVITEIIAEQYEQDSQEFLTLLNWYGDNRSDQRIQDMVMNLYKEF